MTGQVHGAHTEHDTERLLKTKKNKYCLLWFVFSLRGPASIFPRFRRALRRGEKFRKRWCMTTAVGEATQSADPSAGTHGRDEDLRNVVTYAQYRMVINNRPHTYTYTFVCVCVCVCVCITWRT